MTTTRHDELRERLAAISWPPSLARNPDARPEVQTRMTPYASIWEHLAVKKGRSYGQIGDEVKLSLEDQGWTVTQRDRNVKVEGNVIPPLYIPERLLATSLGTFSTSTSGGPTPGRYLRSCIADPAAFWGSGAQVASSYASTRSV